MVLHIIPNVTPRFAIKKDNGTEQLKVPTLVLLQLAHGIILQLSLVIMWGLYIDGAEVGRNENMTIKLSDLGVTNQNYIGKAQ